MKKYIVQPGEDVSQIAFEKFGTTNIDRILKDKKNFSFFQKRDPNILQRGDRLYFDEINTSSIEANVAKRNTFTRKGNRKLKVTLLDILGKKFSNTEYDIVINGKFFGKRKTDKNGLLEENIPFTKCECKVFIKKNEFVLLVANLEPVESTRGVQSRLNNLGYASGPVDGIFGPRTRAATRSFQQDQNIVVDGIVGDQTETHLVAEYGC